MGDHGKRKPDPRPVDLSEPGAVIPSWYWRLSPRARMWEQTGATPAQLSARRQRRTSPIVATMMLAMLGAPPRR